MSAPMTTVAPHPPMPAGRRSRRWIPWTVTGAMLVLIVVGLAAWAVSAFGGPSTNSQPLDPQNPGLRGTRALAQVIDRHGVDVDIVRNQRQFLNARRPDADTTVVVSTNALSAYTAGKLTERARGAARVVLLSPSTTTLESLGLPVVLGAGQGSSAPAACTVPGIAPTDVMSGSGTAYQASTGADATACFPVADGTTGSASMIVVPANAKHPEVVVTSADAFTNDVITYVDNAGVGVRVLGGHSHLIWYIPSAKDVPPTQTKTSSDIPRALGPLIALCFVALLAAMLWRGRRFGKLVVEPLPAVVKAIETTAARGRLYYRARDTTRAAAQLRAHTVRRLTRSLGLPARTEIEALIDTAATASGIDAGYLRGLLAGPLPGDDEQLLTFANDLSRIEEKVHRRYD